MCKTRCLVSGLYAKVHKHPYTASASSKSFLIGSEFRNDGHTYMQNKDCING